MWRCHAELKPLVQVALHYGHRLAAVLQGIIWESLPALKENSRGWAWNLVQARHVLYHGAMAPFPSLVTFITTFIKMVSSPYWGVKLRTRLVMSVCCNRFTALGCVTFLDSQLISLATMVHKFHHLVQKLLPEQITDYDIWKEISRPSGCTNLSKQQQFIFSPSILSSKVSAAFTLPLNKQFPFLFGCKPKHAYFGVSPTERSGICISVKMLKVIFRYSTYYIAYYIVNI